MQEPFRSHLSGGLRGEIHVRDVRGVENRRRDDRQPGRLEQVDRVLSIDVCQNAVAAGENALLAQQFLKHKPYGAASVPLCVGRRTVKHPADLRWKDAFRDERNGLRLPSVQSSVPSLYHVYIIQQHRAAVNQLAPQGQGCALHGYVPCSCAFYSLSESATSGEMGTECWILNRIDCEVLDFECDCGFKAGG